MRQVGTEEPIPAEDGLGDQLRLHEPLGFTMDRRHGHADSPRKLGQTELLAGVKIQPGQKLGLCLAAKDRQQRWSLSSHN